MGRYFGLLNKTKNHAVSNGLRCWKSYDWCDLYEVMHRYGWDKMDKIISAAYDTYNEFNYSEQIDEMSYNTIDISVLLSDNEEDGDLPEKDIPDQDIPEKDIPEKDIPEKICLGFNVGEHSEVSEHDHIPDWDENKVCKKCKYKFDILNIKNDSGKFNGVFYMN
jgi:hypothetical protein